jgi:hypothetical protein
MTKRFLLTCLSVVFVSGCGSQVAKLQKYDPQINYAQQQATVVVRIDNFDYFDLSRLDRSATITPTESSNIEQTQVSDNGAAKTADPGFSLNQINKLDLRKLVASFDSTPKQQQKAANDYRIMKANRWMISNGYSDVIYTIEPGIYYISYVATETGPKVYYSAAPGLSSDNVIAYGAFDIKPGDVLYLGDIECRWNSSTKIKKLVLRNNLAAVKRDLINSGYTQIANRITLAKFYTNGTRVKANDGTYELEEIN